jgi:hypothetical protein
VHEIMRSPSCGCARFAQKTKPRRLIAHIFFADDFQRHGAVQIDVHRLVSHAHRTATQLNRSSVFARHQFIMLKSVRRVSRRRLNRIRRKRLAAVLQSH